MPVEQSYAMFAAQMDEAIRIGADAAMRSGIQWTARNLRVVGTVMVILCGILLSLGLLGMGKLFAYVGRLCLVLLLIGGAAYSSMIADTFSDSLPNEIASAISGNGTTITSAQSFDALSASVSHFTAQIKGQATGLTGIPTRMAADAANAFAKLWLNLLFDIWIIVRFAMRILVAAGAFMLLLLLFESTRGYVLSMFGKAVGLICWQLMAAILTASMIAGAQLYVRDALANPGGSLDAQLDRLFDIGGWFLRCFFVALIVPALAGLGGYSVASGAQSAVFGFIGMALGAAANGLRAAATRLARTTRRRPNP